MQYGDMGGQNALALGRCIGFLEIFERWQPFAAQEAECKHAKRDFDLFSCAHTRRKDDLAAGLRDGQKQRAVSYLSRGHLDSW